MKMTHIAHLSLYTEHVEEMLDFYCNKLGLKRCFTLNMDYPYQMALKDSENLDLSEEFRLLRKNEAKQMEDQRDMMWLTYLKVADGEFIELFRAYQPLESGNVRLGTARLGYSHMSIEVENIAQAVAELERKGVQFRTPIAFGPDFAYQCWLDDPDGNQIELMQYRPVFAVALRFYRICA